jgi:hypothetical protein
MSPCGDSTGTSDDTELPDDGTTDGGQQNGPDTAPSQAPSAPDSPAPASVDPTKPAGGEGKEPILRRGFEDHVFVKPELTEDDIVERFKWSIEVTATALEVSGKLGSAQMELLGSILSKHLTGVSLFIGGVQDIKTGNWGGLVWTAVNQLAASSRYGYGLPFEISMKGFEAVCLATSCGTLHQDMETALRNIRAYDAAQQLKNSPQ